VFDSATEAIKQGGTRRGANMGILRVDHPDIESFITCKKDEKSFNNFNISIALTEELLKKEAEDGEYELFDPYSRRAAKKIRAKDIFGRIIRSAWKNGEPGIVFIDRINRDNPTPHMGEIESTNPCGEQPLLPYESCNLGSLNLSRMLKKGRDNTFEIDWESLSGAVHGAVHFLDNVIEMNQYPLDKIKDTTLGNRKIGLGVMGFADMLIRLAIPYNSDQAIDVAKEVMSFIDRESKKASMALSEKRGTFPNYKGSIYDKKNNTSQSDYKGWMLRNATTTTIAPTGTISIIANTSSGVEPLFAISYLRTVMDNDELVEVHPIFEEIAKERGFYSKELMKKIAHQGYLDDIDEVPDDVKRIFVTAHNVSPEWHVKMQAAFQKYTDNAVSKTINFHNDATEEDVRKAFLLAARLGCKGITIYRDGSREGQVLSTGSTYSSSTKEDPTQTYTTQVVPRPRPVVTRGTTQRISSGCGSLYVTINECDKGKPFEIFTQMGKAGGCAASQSEAIGRLVSLSLRSGIEPDEIVKQLTGISCHMMTWDNGKKILSCSDAISKTIFAYMKNAEEERKKSSAREKVLSFSEGSGVLEPSPVNGKKTIQTLSQGCPDCGSPTEQAGGCVVCRSCGYSKC
ncbi:MAG: adenosylcobalamin-dependent ribonucleoside-diphosphate reductase, partial [Nitrospinota bacterium]